MPRELDKADFDDARELLEIDVAEVSLVDEGAIEREFAIVKRKGKRQNNEESRSSDKSEVPMTEALVADIRLAIPWMRKTLKKIEGAPKAELEGVISHLTKAMLDDEPDIADVKKHLGSAGEFVAGHIPEGDLGESVTRVFKFLDIDIAIEDKPVTKGSEDKDEDLDTVLQDLGTILKAKRMTSSRVQNLRNLHQKLGEFLKDFGEEEDDMTTKNDTAPGIADLFKVFGVTEKTEKTDLEKAQEGFANMIGGAVSKALEGNEQLGKIDDIDKRLQKLEKADDGEADDADDADDGDDAAVKKAKADAKKAKGKEGDDDSDTDKDKEIADLRKRLNVIDGKDDKAGETAKEAVIKELRERLDNLEGEGSDGHEETTVKKGSKKFWGGIDVGMKQSA